MNHTQTQPTLKKTDKKKMPRWVFLVICLLVGHVTLMMTAVTFAVRGIGSAGVEPNYYQRAVQWDANQQALAKSQALGWTVTVTPDIWLDDQQRRQVTVHAQDQNNQPLTHATVQLRMHHAVHPSRRADATLVPNPNAPGQFTAKLDQLQPGPWKIDLHIERQHQGQTQVWIDQREQDLANVTPPTPND